MSEPGRGSDRRARRARGRRRAAPDPGGSEAMRQIGELAGFGLTMALATALFAWLGSLVDGWLGTKPVFVLLGAFAGFGGGFYSMYRRLVPRGDRSDSGATTPDGE